MGWVFGYSAQRTVTAANATVSISFLGPRPDFAISVAWVRGTEPLANSAGFISLETAISLIQPLSLASTSAAAPTPFQVNVAVGYGGRQEIADAVRTGDDETATANSLYSHLNHPSAFIIGQ